MIFGEKTNKVNVKQRSDGTWYCDITYADEGVYKLLRMLSSVIYKAEMALNEHNISKIDEGDKSGKK